MIWCFSDIYIYTFGPSKSEYTSSMHNCMWANIAKILMFCSHYFTYSKS